MSEDDLFEKITEYYLKSRDFNGLPTRVLGLENDVIKALLKNLIKAGDVSIVISHPNPYVKCLSPRPIEEQVESLMKMKDLTHLVAYPEGMRLKKHVKPQKYAGKPFRLAVAKGEATLNCAYFRLDVLERFRNDPRFEFRNNDVVGTIYSKEEGMETEDVYLKSVGFAYDEDMNRAVCIFYTDLMDMSKEQQQYWKHYELRGSYRAHPDFIMSQIYGEWPKNASLAEAITTELRVINDITQDCYGKKLFKADYTDSKRPKELSFLIRPTAKELNAFILMLDKIISDNINSKFFKGAIEPDIETEREDGKIVVSRKSTLTMLSEFIKREFKPANTEPMDEMFNTFKKVRKLRTKPAHSIEEDVFDEKYFKEQRELFIEAYSAVRLLRLILQNHPKADRSRIPEWLYKGNIGTY